MTAVLAIATGVVVAALTWSASPSGGVNPPDGWTDSATGPVGPDDRALLVAVRQAGLWQGPLAQQAGQMAADDHVRSVAATVATAHDGLAARVRSVAGGLGVVLPSLPSGQQQSWLLELSGKRGPDYDRALVNRLHASSVGLRPEIEKVRAGTRNSQVRSVATQAVAVLDRQAADLQGTGLVDPAPAAPAADGSHLPLLVVAAFAALGVFGLVRRRTPPRHRDLILAPAHHRGES